MKIDVRTFLAIALSSILTNCPAVPTNIRCQETSYGCACSLVIDSTLSNCDVTIRPGAECCADSEWPHKNSCKCQTRPHVICSYMGSGSCSCGYTDPDGSSIDSCTGSVCCKSPESMSYCYCSSNSSCSPGDSPISSCSAETLADVYCPGKTRVRSCSEVNPEGDIGASDGAVFEQ
jgi:hypothetical protein